MILSNLITSTNNIIKTNNLKDINLNKIRDLYNKYDGKDWIKKVKYDKNKYTRNLVYRNELFQIILMCWPPKYKSAIHDHNNSECFYKILKGSLIEEVYEIRNDKLIFSNKILLNNNQLGKINDDMGYHSVFNNTDDFTVSLHLYVPIYDSTNIFEIDENNNFIKKEVQLFFDN